jgi:drug/metabolite transporter (DMT)-like permease
MAENLWLSFAFLTASVYATLSLLDKVVLDSEVSTPYITSALNSLPKFAVFIIVGVVTGNTLLTSGLPSNATLVPIVIGISIGAVNVYSRIIYYRGMEVTDVSRFIPVINTDIVFVLVLGAIFLGESFAFPVYLGVFVIFVGTFLISLEDITGDIEIISRQALTFGLLSAFTIALISLMLDYLIPLLDLYAILFWFGVGGIASIVLHGGWKWFRGTLRPDEDSDFGLLSAGSLSLMISGVVTAIAYFTLVWALESGPVSIVTAIANLQVLLVFFGVVVLSKFTPEVLQESMDRVTLAQRFTASILMLVGVVLIQLFS